mgnify:CR=1 FL=1
MKLFGIAIICTVIISLSFFMQSCNKNSGTTAVAATATATDTWTIIQEKIFTPSCATSGCHASSGDATFSQHNLILSSAVAYDNLVNMVSKNTAANTTGLLRVKPSDYVNSLLYQKTDCQAGQNAAKYGATMPLGGPNLTLGQI